MENVIVAMSGGVDSSVAAALLLNRGYRVTGVTMRIWDGKGVLKEGRRHGCYGPGEEEDIEDARKVCQKLDIQHYIFDLREEYRREVLDYLRREYLAGRTPNPCLRCNRLVKFGALMGKARQNGLQIDYFATGHYARVERDLKTGRYLIKKAKDIAKDQTYFISYLSQEQLSRAIFPIGDYTKVEVRNIATELGLKVSNKPESQDFASGGYASLVGVSTPGPIMDKSGRALGEHRGISLYTIGQRKRLGIATEEPLYVINIDCEKNAIIVGGREEIYRDELVASDLNWIAFKKIEKQMELKTKIRAAHKEAEALVAPLSEDKVSVKFKDPQMAITPGQGVVFYSGEVVIGGGTIEQVRE